MPPDVGSSRRTRQRPVVVLPDPDSPTSASASPRPIVKEMPLIAFTLRPRPIGNHLMRSCTTTNGSELPLMQRAPPPPPDRRGGRPPAAHTLPPEGGAT